MDVGATGVPKYALGQSAQSVEEAVSTSHFEKLSESCSRAYQLREGLKHLNTALSGPQISNESKTAAPERKPTSVQDYLYDLEELLRHAERELSRALSTLGA